MATGAVRATVATKTAATAANVPTATTIKVSLSPSYGYHYRTYSPTGLTTACLQQCPAKDQLDQDCAVHDFCTYNYDYTRVLPAGSRFSCSSCTTFARPIHLRATDDKLEWAVLGAQKADYCACDCQLVRSAQTVSNTNSFYKSAIIFIFTHITDCWY
jgi:hypothetical protein